MSELTPETLQQQTEKMRQRLLKTTYGSSVHAASHRVDELRGCFAIMDEVIAVWGAARKRIEELEKGRVGYENELSGHRAWRDHYEARIEALESDKAAMRLEIVTIIGMYGDNMHPRVKQALEAVAVACPNAALRGEEER